MRELLNMDILIGNAISDPLMDAPARNHINSDGFDNCISQPFDALLDAPIHRHKCVRFSDPLFDAPIKNVEKSAERALDGWEGFKLSTDDSEDNAIVVSPATLSCLKERGDMQLALTEIADKVTAFWKLKRVGDNIYYYKAPIWRKLSGYKELRKITASCLDCHDLLKTQQFKEIYNILQGRIEKYDYLNLNDERYQNFICFNNGIYDVMSDTMLAHEYKYPFLNYIDFDYMPGVAGDGPVFDAYLISVSQDNSNVRKRILQWMGYVSCPLPNLKKIALLVGERDSGKTTLANVMVMIIGEENVQSFNMEHIGRFTNHAMFGKLLGLCTDLSGKRLKPEAMEWLKEQTGGDHVSAEVKFGDQYSYVSNCRYIIASNFRPNLGNDDALENRFLTIPFPVSVPDEEKNVHLLEDIRSEMQHVFYLMFEELREFIRNGMKFANIGELEYYVPQNCMVKHESVMDFYEDCCLIEAGSKIGGTELYKYYVPYCHSIGAKPISERSFCTQFKKIADSKGIKEDRNDTRGYKGLSVRDILVDNK